MNILVGDGWALVEKDDAAMARVLKANGITPILLPFQNFQSLGGSFHCATLDIRSWDLSDFDSSLSADRDYHIYYDAREGRYRTEPLDDFLNINRSVP